LTRPPTHHGNGIFASSSLRITDTALAPFKNDDNQQISSATATSAPTTPCEHVETVSEEDFIHGFIAGFILIGALTMCRCRNKPNKTLNEDPWPVRAIPNEPEEVGAREYYDDSKLDMNQLVEAAEGGNSRRGSDDVVGANAKDASFSPKQTSVLMATTTATSTFNRVATNVGGLAHIPRPKQNVGASSSPLIS
jgi:hypothetical protein